VLLPQINRWVEIPKKGGLGRVNVSYPTDHDGSARNESWRREALQFINDYRSSNLLIEPEADSEDDVSAAVERALARFEGQGFARDKKERDALENHAMRRVRLYFKRSGFITEDVSKSQPFDFLCKRGNSELHIEVKGTTTSGKAIILTYNEVMHAKQYKHCALAIVHSICLDKRRKKANGGNLVVISPWRPNQGRLKPISYIYTMDKNADHPRI
jgi:hypothetical protein